MQSKDLQRAADSRWVEGAGRFGLLAKGAIHAVIGLLAIQIPLDTGGKATDRQGALRTVAAQPAGEVLLFILAAGFGGYALWRLMQAIFDRSDEGHGVKGLAKRAGYLGRGLFYAGSCFVALALVVGLGSGGSNEQEETALVLDLPLGRWIVAGVGLGFLGAGAFNGYRSLTGKFREHLKEHEIGPKARPWTIAVGVFGHAARAVVFALIGVFLLRAALQYDPREAIGIDGALRKVAQAEQGEFLLSLVAGGFLAYAAYCVVQARYREV